MMQSATSVKRPNKNPCERVTKFWRKRNSKRKLNSNPQSMFFKKQSNRFSLRKNLRYFRGRLNYFVSKTESSANVHSMIHKHGVWRKKIRLLCIFCVQILSLKTGAQNHHIYVPDFFRKRKTLTHFVLLKCVRMFDYFTISGEERWEPENRQEPPREGRHSQVLSDFPR